MVKINSKSRLAITLLGVGAFYLLALAGTFAVVWMNAAHKTEALLDYSHSDLHSTVDEVVDAVLANVGVAIVNHLGAASPKTLAEMKRMAVDYNVDEINIVNKQGIIIGSNDPSSEHQDMANYSPISAEFMVLTNGTTRVFSQKFRANEPDHTVFRKYLGVPFPYGEGFVEVGYDEEKLARSFRETFSGMLSKWCIGESGFFICADKSTSLVVVPVPGHPEMMNKSLLELGFDLFDIPKDDNWTFAVSILGQRCHCRHFVYGRHRMFTVLPAAEFYGPAIQSVMMAAAVLLIVFFVFGYVIGRMVTQQRRIDDLRHAEDIRREKDLQMARTIQLSALPLAFPKVADFNLFAKMVTAREVGGDFYDFVTRADGKVLIMVADVSGKGVPAALFMMRAKTIVRSAVAENPDDLAEAVRLSNENLADHNEAEMFVTGWIGIYDPSAGDIEYVNAGHNPPLIKRADGSVEWVRERGGMALAAIAGAHYRTHVCHLEPGDSILLYTDGVTEAMNAAGEQFGEARLEKLLTRAGGEFVTEVSAAIASFVGSAEQSDDITLLALDRIRQG